MGCGAAINGLELARTWTQTQQMQPHRAMQPHPQMQEVMEKDQVSLHLAIDVPSVHMSFTDDVEVRVAPTAPQRSFCSPYAHLDEHRRRAVAGVRPSAALHCTTEPSCTTKRAI